MLWIVANVMTLAPLLKSFGIYALGSPKIQKVAHSQLLVDRELRGRVSEMAIQEIINISVFSDAIRFPILCLWKEPHSREDDKKHRGKI